MKPSTYLALITILSAPAVWRTAIAEHPSECPRDSVLAGTVCIDKYEASIWETTNPNLIRKIKKGTISRYELLAGGAVQRRDDRRIDPDVLTRRPDGRTSMPSRSKASDHRAS